MRSVLLLDDKECEALHALSLERSAYRFRAGDRPARVAATLRVLRTVGQELMTLGSGGVLDKRLERIGGALVHDHTDRQLSRLVARKLETQLGDRVPFRLTRSSTSCRIAATLTLVRNAGRVRLFSGSLHPEVAGVVAQALLVGGAVNASLRSGGDQPRALAVSHDLNEVRLVLGFVATRAAIPILIVLHDFGASGWTGAVTPWVRALTYDCALVHDVHHVSTMDPPPRSICVFTPIARRTPRRPVDGLVVGIVVDVAVDPQATVRMAGELAARSAVRRVLIRRHPRISAVDWAVELPSGVAYADPMTELEVFAEDVDVAVVSATSASNPLIRAGLPCLFWDGFDRAPTSDSIASDPAQRLAGTPDPELSDALGLTLYRLGVSRDTGTSDISAETRVPVIDVTELVRRFDLDGMGV